MEEPETVEHLFCRCRHLTKAREILEAKLGRKVDWGRLMTCDALIAVDWAIDCFGLRQFHYAKTNGFHRSCFGSSLKGLGIDRERLYPVNNAS